jgi:sulfatase modifying factor 1
MENRGVLIGSIIFVFGSFILMIGGLVYESYKAKQMRQHWRSRLRHEAKPVAAPVAQDFSMYKTLVGDDGREMVQISEGPFVMGSRDNDSDPDEKPEHQVYLKTYFLDKHEVTQDAYDRFLKMTRRVKRKIEVFEDDPTKLLKSEYPAIAVTWDDAEAYCKWAGKRLPTEAEWEKAARGEGKRRYAWGDEFISGYANIDGTEDGFRYLAPPGSFESGRSPYGIYDMTGNVGEWVADVYDENFIEARRIEIRRGLTRANNESFAVVPGEKPNEMCAPRNDFRRNRGDMTSQSAFAVRKMSRSMWWGSSRSRHARNAIQSDFPPGGAVCRELARHRDSSRDGLHSV